MKRKKYISLALAALLSPGVVMADEHLSTKVVPTMGEVVVTATKTDEQRRDVPNAVILKDSSYKYDLIILRIS